MCRIAGIVSLSDNVRDLKPDLQRMLSALRHGGPDDEGVFTENNVFLGHRRLSIIDLSADGHQPMLSEDGKVVISYNGEIYNFSILKTELEKQGIRFSTQSDTEVIIRAYERWGEGAFKMLEGIFAFSLYDKRHNSLYLVRDQIGVKPLYYFVNKEELIFASEVKAFLALRQNWQENKEWKTLFLAFGSLPYPHTTLADVFQVEAGTFLKFDTTNVTFKTQSYFAINTDGNIFSVDKSLDTINGATEDALRKNMISDAPLGIFLSGGIDSSLLTLLADRIEQNVKTVSVNFEDATFDERPYQQMILDKTQHLEHHSYNVNEAVFWENIEDVWNAMDQPSIDGVNTYFVSQCARRAGLKTVLSGIGADEVFGGYESIKRVRWLKTLRILPFRNAIAKLLGYYKKSFRRLVFLSLSGATGDYLFLRGIHTPDVIARLLNIPEREVWKTLEKVSIQIPTASDNREYVSMLELKVYLVNQLLKDTDYMSMWHGLEVRAPFLDIALLNTVSKISPAIKYRNHSPKYLLTAAFSDLLPREIIYRKKAGFTFPFALWMKNEPERFKRLALDGTPTEEVIQDFENGHSHWSKYWSLIVLKQFKVIVN